ncbi:uncharacterized protein EV422DRAFT_505444 [Fimicolochytrium jonesii]|uniref:uncharacterized protein n=1 Tax=Fimicolochytrium jonesii TaxID=1396493 RepID=UPI0022FF0C76|nr:uncharacterized protein EV422DRAFT_505444 [Fimicolochytrium jonesii]KAI8822656.1 hypothetical protein EV422DRAFT_505444 [Fimicolochytrium jonesii]
MSRHLRAQRKWLQNNKRKLADEAEEPLKAKLNKLWQRAESLDQAGVDDYANFLDVVFDNPTIKTELEEKLLKATSDIEDLKNDNEDLKNDNRQLNATLDAQARSALRRQIAINIDWEVKMDFLQLTSEDKTASMKYGYGPRKGQSKGVVFGCQLEEVAAEKEDLNDVMETWFGPPENGKSEMFKGTMESLKQFSVDPHPIAYKGVPVDANMARELVQGIKEEFLVDVAVEVSLWWCLCLKDIKVRFDPTDPVEA